MIALRPTQHVAPPTRSPFPGRVSYTRRVIVDVLTTPKKPYLASIAVIVGLVSSCSGPGETTIIPPGSGAHGSSPGAASTIAAPGPIAVVQPMPSSPAAVAPAVSTPVAPGNATASPAPTQGPNEPSEAESSEPEPLIPLGPTPANDTANFPFPQNRELPNCQLPTRFSNDDVMAAFEKWRDDTVTSEGANGAVRIQRLESDPVIAGDVHSTVSEGIAYGMLIAVYMNEQEMFDGLWRYEQQWLNDTGLMHWHISSAGDRVIGNGAASDADEDIAWALIMADRQWGGGGSLDSSYVDLARGLIDQIWQHEILDGKLFLPGDSWGGWDSVNISYFTPNYYRAFAEVTGNQGWNDVVQTSYDTMFNSLNDANGNATNGLVPAWSTSEGQPNGGVWGPDQQAPTHYQYDSCRTPFRIGLDYCFNGEEQARQYVQMTSGFFSGIGVANMTDGYELNGSPRPQFGGLSAAFVGPAGVGAMSDPAHQQFVDDAYDALKGLDLLVGGAYYDESWTVLALLMMTGNFLDYTAIDPL